MPYPRVPAYTDISHFRAPYKEAFLSGFGQLPSYSTSLVGGTAAVPTGMEQYVEEDDKGLKRWKPETAKAMMEKMRWTRAQPLADDMVDVSLTVASATEQAAMQEQGLTAAQWIKKKTGEGKVVCATIGVVGPLGVAQLIAVPKGNDTDVRNTSQVAPILAEPGLFGAGLTVGGAVLLVLLGGGLILASRKGKRRAIANRRRRGRSRRRARRL